MVSSGVPFAILQRQKSFLAVAASAAAFAFSSKTTTTALSSSTTRLAMSTSATGTPAIQQPVRVQIEASKRSNVPVDLEWLPFLLNPSMPNGEGQDLEEHLVGKYGPSAATSIHDPNSSLKKMGRQMGFEFNMDRRMVNTKRAHAVMEYLKKNDESTKGNDVANLFMEDLYKSYFEDAKNINDPTVLLDILLKGDDKKYGGVNVEEVKTFLQEDDSDKIEYEITNLDREVKTKYGVRGVPFFMIHPNKSKSSGGGKDNRPVAFSGAYPVEIIAEQLEIAAAAAAGAAADDEKNS